MKRTLVSLVVVGAAAAVLSVWLSPYWAVAGLAQSAQAGDVIAVATYLDLPRLRQSAKFQATRAIVTEAGRKKKAIIMVGAVLGAAAADKMIDETFTPENLTTLLATLLQDRHGSRLSYTLSLVASDHAAWRDDSTFQIRIDDRSSIYWRREGQTWRLSELEVPLVKERRS
jgi:DUF2939 family protein